MSSKRITKSLTLDMLISLRELGLLPDGSQIECRGPAGDLIYIDVTSFKFASQFRSCKCLYIYGKYRRGNFLEKNVSRNIVVDKDCIVSHGVAAYSITCVGIVGAEVEDGEN